MQLALPGKTGEGNSLMIDIWMFVVSLRDVRTGSFFEDSKIPLGQWLYVIFLWSIDESNKRLSLLTGLSLRTVVTTLETTS